MRTREHRWAADADRRVRAHVDREPTWRDQYLGMARRLPALVRSAGLAQAVAFVRTRKEPAHDALLADLAATLAMDVAELSRRSREADLVEYMVLTHHVLGALQWYRRFAEALLDAREEASAP
jgi:CRISPR-associated protein Cmr5